jgi:hypothetical protein
MSPAEPADAQTPLLLTQSLRSTTPAEQVEEIATAIHEYVRVHRQRPQFLAMHPETYRQLAPLLHEKRAREPTPEEQQSPLDDRLAATLDPGAIILSDTDDPAWEQPADA